MKKLGIFFGILFAVLLTAFLTFSLTTQFYEPPLKEGGMSASSKLSEIESILEAYFVDEYDPEQIADAAANAAIEATGDRWSYYIPSSEYQKYEEHVQNAYVGVGVLITAGDGDGFPITSVTEGSPADQAGICVGDMLIRADGADLSDRTIAEVQQIVRGEQGTSIQLTVRRNGEEIEFMLVRAAIEKTVAEGEMVTDDIGCIIITNFDQNSAKQTISEIEMLLDQGAKALIFDVRLNPGGLRSEMVEILDRLLPEGDIFRGVEYDGQVSIDCSDPNCLSLPMAVLVDKNSYSAAEFFAAALQECNWATVIGEQTSGKGNYQYTFPLSDGSAVAISVGKYYTQSGRSLDGVGVIPDISISLSEEQQSELYYGVLSTEDDAQLQRAIEILTKKIS